MLLISMIYQLIYYMKHSKRLGLLLLYGSGKIGVMLVILLENGITFVLSLLVNLLAGVGINLQAALFLFIFVVLASVICSLRFLFIDIYHIIRD
jgi:hypothetical protein